MKEKENKEASHEGHHGEHDCCGEKAHGEAESHEGHEGHGDHEGHDHTEHHRLMAEDFKRRFFISLPLTIIVLILSPKIQEWLGFTIDFPSKNFFLEVNPSLKRPKMR